MQAVGGEDAAKGPSDASGEVRDDVEVRAGEPLGGPLNKPGERAGVSIQREARPWAEQVGERERERARRPELQPPTGVRTRRGSGDVIAVIRWTRSAAEV